MRSLAIDEDGAAYTISYVMVIPVFMLLVCMIIELVIMFNAKLGTIYAGFAAARTASVWNGATNWDNTVAKAKFAAVKSMAPMASGVRQDTVPASSGESIAFLNAYHDFSTGTVNDTYILKKFAYAKDHVKIDIAGPPVSARDDIVVKITYEYPFNIPGIGRILGKRGADGRFFFPITSTVAVPNEAPQDDRPNIGIGYGTLE